MLQIQSVLDRLKVSRSELANRLGVSRTAVNQYINGNPTAERLQAIASALGVPIIELFAPDTEVHGYVRVRTDLHEVKSFRDLQRLADLEHTPQQANSETE